MTKVKSLTKKYILPNIQWKIIAVVLAVILWMVALNILDPIQTERITLQLYLRNLDILAENGKVLVDEAALSSTTVDVIVQGNFSEMVDLQNRVRASVDLAHPDIISGESNANIAIASSIYAYITGNYNLTITQVFTSSVNVFVDDVVSEVFEVTVNYGGTFVATDFLDQSPRVVPSEIVITGPRAAMNRIAIVSVEVDLTDRNDEFTIQRDILVTNFAGVPVEGISLGATQANVTVPILMRNNILIQTPQITGTPAPGFAVTGIQQNIYSILAYGSRTDIQRTPRIYFSDINIQGATSNIIYYPDLASTLAGRGLTIYGPVSSLEFIVTVEPLATRTIPVSFSTDVSVFGFNPGVSFVNHNITFNVVVEGISRYIDDITASDLTFSIELANLPFGSHSVPLRANPPVGVTIIGALPLIGVIVEDWTVQPTAPPTQPPTPSPDPTPTPTPSPEPTPTPEPSPTPSPSPEPTLPPSTPEPTPPPSTPEPTLQPSPPPINGLTGTTTGTWLLSTSESIKPHIPALMIQNFQKYKPGGFL